MKRKPTDVPEGGWPTRTAEGGEVVEVGLRLCDFADPRKGLPTDPETLRREMLTILVAFNRFQPSQLAVALGATEDEIQEMRADPDVMEVVRDLRALLPRPGEINELLMSDAERNVRWLRKLREGRFDGVNPRQLRIRARAAEVLLDRQVPKKVAVSVEAPPPIEVTALQVERMRALMAPEPDEDEAAPDVSEDGSNG